MNNPDYEKAKIECWEEFKGAAFNGNTPYSTWSAFDFAFDYAYALGKQAKSKRMCLRNKSKACDLCHECDIDISNPRY